jgi:hypothetical protein
MRGSAYCSKAAAVLILWLVQPTSETGETKLSADNRCRGLPTLMLFIEMYNILDQDVQQLD